LPGRLVNGYEVLVFGLDGGSGLDLAEGDEARLLGFLEDLLAVELGHASVLGVLLDLRVARLASLLTGVMIFLWVLRLHIPRAIADPYTYVGNEWASVFEALAFSGMAFMLTAPVASWNIADVDDDCTRQAAR